MTFFSTSALYLATTSFVVVAPITLSLAAMGWLLLRDGIVDEKGSARGINKERDALIVKVCGGDDSFARSLMRWSFARASLKRLFGDLSDVIIGKRVAREGSFWPDAQVFELGNVENVNKNTSEYNTSSEAAILASSGQIFITKTIPRRLHSFLPTEPGRPLILNFVIARDFATSADFLTVYIAEAHASDEWALPEAEGAGSSIPKGIVQPKSLEARASLASCFASRFPSVGRIVVDNMSDSANRAYAAWPERLYIIVDGVIVYKSGPGPFGYVLDDVRSWLEKHVVSKSN